MALLSSLSRSAYPLLTIDCWFVSLKVNGRIQMHPYLNMLDLPDIGLRYWSGFSCLVLKGRLIRAKRAR